ncbi:haloacid type ii [Moniliophthora roreri MCA 2997]|uniref:Haloacid type ii n=1 Tax=Moniliophthora roreri (strain MCA 2997) TaxID=1381753 RepID=V2XHY7_MONRO|nr:haloacid type ii [Moniliophthora roreri MCA 2997]
MDGIEALIFDVFGTTVDWRKSVVKELQEIGEKHGLPFSPEDWGDFADEWRVGYMENTRRIAGGGSGTNDVDTMHREILEGMLSSERWSKVGSVLDEPARKHLNFVWHRLEGWPDTVSGLYGLKKHTIVTCLSNGNIRLLVDMAKFADLPWDAIFSAALFDSYKPNPKTYQGALRHLALSETPHKAAMVAAHIFDLRSAAKVGLKTIYVRRTNEEEDGVKAEDIKSKAEGGEVDVVVNSIEELVHLFANAK